MPTGFQRILPSPPRPLLPPRAVPLSMRRPNMLAIFECRPSWAIDFSCIPANLNLHAAHPCHPLATRTPIDMHDLPWCVAAQHVGGGGPFCGLVPFSKDQRLALFPPTKSTKQNTYVSYLYSISLPPCLLATTSLLSIMLSKTSLVAPPWASSSPPRVSVPDRGEGHRSL